MSTPRSTHVRAALTLLLAVALVVVFMPTVQGAQGDASLSEFAKENHVNTHSQPLALVREKNEHGAEVASGPDIEAYANRAYPQGYIDYDQAIAAAKANEAVSSRVNPQAATSAWKLIGPSYPQVPGIVTYTGRPTTVSGRITSLAISQYCVPQNCRIYLGAAGGGIWRADDALVPQPAWTNIGASLGSNSIGSITIDPTVPSGQVVYAGTGEPNGSSDSEAGIGMYKSTDYGNHWTLMTGSVHAAKDRSIAGIAVDPVNANHIYIGTAVARHGMAAVYGGRFTPPDAPKIGLYELTDGGTTFSLVFALPSDVPDPTTINGNDYFRGGVSKVLMDRTGLAANEPSRVYFSVFDYGLFRSAKAGTFEEVFASAGHGLPSNSLGSRTEFALAPKAGKLRIYLGDDQGVLDANGNDNADFYRVDDANNAPASTLTNGVSNPGWTKLSNPKPGTPGYASYDFCNGQCSYDMVVASPSGQPDTVWIGGSMQYCEINQCVPPAPNTSNGRAIQRSTDGGVSFTDMTNDNQSPPLGMHPDQHAIVFNPNDPNIALVGSDGGIISNSGKFVDASAQCNTRGLHGADLVDCKQWLSKIPTRLYAANAGLSTLQYQSVFVNPNNPQDILGGTQDNGTWANNTNIPWFETVGGDGGQSGIDVGNPNTRVHSYYNAQHDVNFHNDQESGWDWISDPLLNSGEAQAFYTALTQDPRVPGTIYDGLQHVWRTKDSGGPQPYLDKVCNEYTGTRTGTCGDWVPLGKDLTSTAFGSDRTGQYIGGMARTKSDAGTLWASTRTGRVFITKNADANNPNNVVFTRIDTANTPGRFVSSIVIDPSDSNHAWISYSGYNAYTPTTPGHVFDVTFHPGSGAATFKDISFDLGDQPITYIQRDNRTGTLYAATDFGVLQLTQSSWTNAAPGLPKVAVYGLTLDASARVLFAATHGRSVWQLQLPLVPTK